MGYVLARFRQLATNECLVVVSSIRDLICSILSDKTPLPVAVRRLMAIVDDLPIHIDVKYCLI